jgi:hypothetical protein
VVDFTTLSAAQIIQVQITTLLMNKELEKTWMETVAA